VCRNPLRIAKQGAWCIPHGIAICEVAQRDQQINIQFGVCPKVMVNLQRDQGYPRSPQALLCLVF
jgi:hypothetical protein